MGSYNGVNNSSLPELHTAANAVAKAGSPRSSDCRTLLVPLKKFFWDTGTWDKSETDGTDRSLFHTWWDSGTTGVKYNEHNSKVSHQTVPLLWRMGHFRDKRQECKLKLVLTPAHRQAKACTLTFSWDSGTWDKVRRAGAASTFNPTHLHPPNLCGIIQTNYTHLALDNYYNYFTEIEDAFIRRRGKNLLLSPMDWALIEGWRERDIPLHIVLRAIESVFDGWEKQPNQTRTIKSLFYCREEVEAQHAEWIASQAGKNDHVSTEDLGDQFSLESIAKHIDEVIEKLKEVKDTNLREDVDRAIARLEELRTGLVDDLEYIDKTLYDIESFLDRALLEHSESGHLKELKKETTSQLRQYKSAMDADAYKKAYELLMLKRLREDLGIPRLGLFYL